MRAGRLRREAMGVLVGAACAPIGLMIAMWVVGLGDPDGPSFAEVTGFLFHRRPGLFADAAVSVASLLTLATVAQRLLVGSRLRRVFRRILRTRFDVNIADPQLAFRTRVVVNDDGMESRSASGSTLVRWSSVDRWEETGGRLLVLGRAMDGFCLNTAGIDRALVRQFRCHLATRPGDRDPPKR